MATSGEGKQSADSLDFLDIVFTVMLTVGLTPEALNGDQFKGVLSEPLFDSILRGKQPAPLRIEDWQRLSTLLVGLLTLLLSWFGLRPSLKNKQIQFDRVCGMFRFILDVGLIVLYGIILICFKRLDAVLQLLFSVYCLYVLWDLFKIVEYCAEFFDRDKQRMNHIRAKAKVKWFWGWWRVGHDLDDWLRAEKDVKTLEAQHPRCVRLLDLWWTFSRQLVSLQFALWFFLLWWLYPIHMTWSVLLFAMLFTLLYRIAKIYPRFGSIAAVAVGLAACVFNF